MAEWYVTAEEICSACARTIGMAPSSFPNSLPPNSRANNEPTWYSFEHEAWEIGERIRRSFVRKRKLRENPSVLNAFAEVIGCENLRRGRQSFVMTLAAKSEASFAPFLARFLSDPDIDGHVVKSLLEMKAAGYGREISPHLSSKYTWIRKIARRYIDRFGDA